MPLVKEDERVEAVRRGAATDVHQMQRRRGRGRQLRLGPDVVLDDLDRARAVEREGKGGDHHIEDRQLETIRGDRVADAGPPTVR